MPGLHLKKEKPPRAPPSLESQDDFTVLLPRLKTNDGATQLRTLLGKRLQLSPVVHFKHKAVTWKPAVFQFIIESFRKLGVLLGTALLLPLMAFQRQTASESGVGLSPPTPARRLRGNGCRPRAPSVLQQRVKQIT